RVIAYDRRGFGKSSQPWTGYDYDTLSDDLKILIDELELEDVILVGFSMGGGEVVRYFSRHGGENISKAVLISSVTPYMLKTQDNPGGVAKQVFDEMDEEMKEDRMKFLQDFVKTFYGVGLLTKPVSDAYMQHDFTIASGASPHATAECAKAFTTTDFRDEMPLVFVPTLIVHGDSDKTVPIESSGEKSAGLIPDAKYLVYGGSPHGLFYTDKERLNEDLLEFLLS
ncbi:MAG: alpha/beta hydrolase, partial [Flavobacterium sp.]